MSFEPPSSADSTWPLPRARTIWHQLRAIEAAASISALIIAMWQFLLIDRSLVGFAVFWTIPLVFVVILETTGHLSRKATIVATIYLLLVALGTWIGSHHGILPGLGAEHPGRTNFADKWNRLDLTSRRLIAWNMSVNGIVLWILLPYFLFVRQLIRHARGLSAHLSAATCWFGLAVFWLPLLIALPYLISMIF